MDYRDEREALRARQEALEEELVEKDREIARLRAREPESSGLAKPLAVVAGLVLVGTVVTVLKLQPQRAPPPPPPPEERHLAPRMMPPVVSVHDAGPADKTQEKLEGQNFWGVAALNDGEDGVLVVTSSETWLDAKPTVSALRGTPLTARWRVRSFGGSIPRVWTSADRALVVDDHAGHVYATEDGREVGVLAQLDMSAPQACIKKHQALLLLPDGRRGGIDLESGTSDSSAEFLEQEGCVSLARSDACAHVSAPRCGSQDYPNADISTRASLTDDGATVTLGVRVGGEVVAVGSDPKTHARRWTTTLLRFESRVPGEDPPKPIAALDGDLFAMVDVSTLNLIYALDARTGDRRFAHEVGDGRVSPTSVAIGRTRIFVGSKRGLFVFDRATGEPLEEISDRHHANARDLSVNPDD